MRRELGVILNLRLEEASITLESRMLGNLPVRFGR